jgi:NAD(P)-dependent dehydrogenase (short-subunit alcohol dehydrogenase family)
MNELHLTGLFDLTGRVAVVTGASSGLGVAFAHALGAAGAKVVLAARRADRLESVVNQLADSGVEAISVSVDVTDEGDVTRLHRATLERFGRVDVLVNNAGISASHPAESEPLESFRRVIDVDLTSVFLCSQVFGRTMLEARRGSIVNIASMLGVVGSGQIPQASYTAAKGGVVNLTRDMAAQWARRGVRVNAIAPGYFPSEMTADMFADERTHSWIEKRLPIGRTGEPRELVGTLLLLASDAGSYIVGQTIVVDGGWTIV